MINWEIEWPLIKERASYVGVNAYFIAAIRKQENGGPGREFGVLLNGVNTYADQLAVACRTVTHRMSEYRNILFLNESGILIMSPEFIRWFANIWAPVGADNDPQNLNANWPRNVIKFQAQFVRDEKPS